MALPCPPTLGEPLPGSTCGLPTPTFPAALGPPQPPTARGLCLGPDRLPHTSLSLSDLPSAVATLAAATSETLPDRYWPGAGPPPPLLPAPAAGLCPPSAEARGTRIRVVALAGEAV